MEFIKTSKTIKNLILDTLKDNSEEILYEIDKRKISYKEVYKQMKCLGTSLLEMNLENKKIAIMSENRYEWELTYLTVICGIGPIVPIDKTLPENEIINILTSSNITTIFCSKSYERLLKNIKKKTKLENIISFDNKAFKNLIIEGEKLLNNNKRYIRKEIDENKIAVILHTSGTTSKSKVVALSNKNLYSNVVELKETLNVNSKDRFLSFLPLHHVFECTFGFLYPISVGAKIIFSKGIRHILSELKEKEITVMANVPVVYEMLLKQIEKQIEKGKTTEKILGDQIKYLISGAAYLNPLTELKYRNLSINLMQAYGLSETSPVVTMSTNKDYRVGSVGKPLKNLKIKVIKKDKDKVGELLVKGDSVMLGYLKDNTLSKESFKRKWFCTGDLVYVDKNKFVYIKGRKKNVIVLENGENIYPEELENIINDIRGVKESLVFDKNNKLNAKIIIDKEDILNYYNINEKNIYVALMKEIKKINKKLPLYKNIKDIIVSEEPLIKTATNKIKRNENIKEIL